MRRLTNSFRDFTPAPATNSSTIQIPVESWFTFTRSEQDGHYRLFTISGSGGTIVEAAFAVADIPVEIIDVDWDDLGWKSTKLIQYNPLGQVPTLILPDDRVMTESAAIILHLADIRPQSGLAPDLDHADRPDFLRWLIFLASAIYPTFTYGDVPNRWVSGDETAGKKLLDGTDAHRKTLYRYMEKHAGTPWFLGELFSCIDLYFLVMRDWRPGIEWFEQECPRLNAIGLRSAAVSEVKEIAKKLC